jgi:hypothetical protein
MSKADLDKTVADTSRIAEEWAANIRKIESQIANANSRLEKSEAHRKKFALDASLGNPDAISQITKARAESLSAAGDQADLSHALADAKLRLVEVEGAAKAAMSNLAKFEVEILQRKRVDIAGELDQVSADFARLYAQYEALGAQIVSMDVLPRTMVGMSNHEGAVGAKRVRASLPPLFWKLFPGAIHDEMKTENLATSEARFWNLAPEHDEKSKAA